MVTIEGSSRNLLLDEWDILRKATKYKKKEEKKTKKKKKDNNNKKLFCFIGFFSSVYFSKEPIEPTK